MTISSFKMVLFVSLAVTHWMKRQGSSAEVSMQMKKHASFDGNLPVMSACYNSEIENISPLYCASQCLTRPNVCYGILFNWESETCKIIKCNPAYVFFEEHFDPGRWDLLWKENGMHYIIFFTITSCVCQSETFCLSLFIFFSLSVKIVISCWDKNQNLIPSCVLMMTKQTIVIV